MFKHAYVRGVQNALIQSGHVAFPDENTAAKVADHIATASNFEPLNDGGVHPSITSKLAEAIVDASRWFQEKGYKVASFTKLASVEDLSKLAHAHASDLMQKAAEGSTIEGGDKGNKENESPQAETKMDTSQRPSGYAEDSRGKTDVDTKPGAVGKEQEHPKAPSESPSGDNSVKEQSRTASLARFLKKTAEGTTILGGDKGNKEPTTAEGKMDLGMRPHGYAVLPNQGDLGEMMAHFNAQSAVGKEQPHPNAPANSPSGSNSIIETSHKSAEDQAFLTIFKKTASEIGEYLPGGLSDDTKVAHVRACMGMTTEEKARYLSSLQKEAAEKTAGAPAAVPPGSRGDHYAEHSPEKTHSRPGAYDGRHANQGTSKHGGELPSFIQDKIDAKKDGEGKSEEKSEEKGEKKDEKHEEKKEEKEEKEASLAAQMRRIASSIRTA
jgi:hypothetical protein